MIKCYLVSNKALQLNHTYYSFDEFTDVELFYKLEECTHLLDDLYKKTFVYEVEVISDKTPEKFAYNYFLADYILNRQITQEQFEKLCSLYKRDILTFNFRVKSAAILAGYKILPEYRKLFYPFVLYHGVENCLDLIDKESKSSEPLYALFYCGYKFKNFDYSSMPWNKEVSEAKTIFQNGFKYIE